jgi:hypothetical protein
MLRKLDYENMYKYWYYIGVCRYVCMYAYIYIYMDGEVELVSFRTLTC